MLSHDDFAAIRLTLELAAVTTVLLLLLGTPIAWWLSRTRSRLKGAVAAVVALVLQVRHDSTNEARNRSVAVAQAFANAPGTVETLSAPDPSAVFQPQAEAARVTTGVSGRAFVTAMPARVAAATSMLS